QPLCLRLIERCLRLLDKRDDVTHLQYASCHSLRVEFFEGIELLTNADILDRLLRDTIDGERRSATRVAVHFGQHHACDVERLVEPLCDLDRVLSSHAVSDEQNLRWTQSFFEGKKFVHHWFVDLQPAGRVDNHDAVALAQSFSDS